VPLSVGENNANQTRNESKAAVEVCSSAQEMESLQPLLSKAKTYQMYVHSVHAGVELETLHNNGVLFAKDLLDIALLALVLALDDLNSVLLDDVPHGNGDNRLVLAAHLVLKARAEETTCAQQSAGHAGARGR